MKTQILFLSFISMGLVACGGGGGGGGSSNSTPPAAVDIGQITTPGSNLLTIKGDGINKQEQVVATEKEIVLFAVGNQPMHFIMFEPKLGQSQSQTAGGIRLLPESTQAGLILLRFDKDAKTQLSCQSGNACEEHSNYSLEAGSQRSLLSINFNQSPNTYVIKKSNQQIPVKVSGNLQFGIPASWPVLQAKRFPVMDVKGSLVWAGETYQLERLGKVPRIWWGGPRTISLYFKSISGSSKALELVLNIDHDDTFNIRLDDGGESSYSFYGSSYKKYFFENDRELHLKLNKLVLSDFDDNRLILSSDLRFPKLFSDVSFNGYPVFEDVVGISGAARNASKTYSITFQSSGISDEGEREIETTYLNLNQELSGHVWMSYSVRSNEYVCGSVTKNCPGLSLDPDQKTWRFNNVDLFKQASKLNGMLYIPGIVE